MKINLLACGTVIPILFFVFFISNTRAELGVINIKIKATLVAGGCTVSSGSREVTVNMGEWEKKYFSVKPERVLPVPFSILLTNCGTMKEVTVTFRGLADAIDPSLLAISGGNAAKNIGIAILDKNKKRIPLGRPTDIYNVAANTESITLNFYGQYVANGKGNVTPGTANADTTFTIEYP